MGQVDAFHLPGLELWFNSNDHRPPHFHVEKPGEWEVIVRFLRARSEMCEVRWSSRQGAPSKADLGAIAKTAEAHRRALLVEWETKVRVSDPGPER